MTRLEIKLFFDKNISMKDARALKNFMRGRTDEISAYTRLDTSMWKTAFENHDYICSLFFDYLKETYGKEKIAEGIKKGTPKKEARKTSFEDFKKICEETPIAKKIQESFKGRIL